MAIRQIFQEGSDVLHKHCREVTVFDKKLGDLIDDMFETMIKADGVGLAAPQVGFLRRLAVVECDDMNGEHVKLEMVNPVIIHSKGEQIDEEGCLSVDSTKNCEVLRPFTVTVKAQDRFGKEYEKTVSGLPARAICHELDHLEGILFYTKAYKGTR